MRTYEVMDPIDSRVRQTSKVEQGLGRTFLQVITRRSAGDLWGHRAQSRIGQLPTRTDAMRTHPSGIGLRL